MGIACPNCGTAMNRHAAKLIEPRHETDRHRMDPVLGGIVAEVHACPRCGGMVSERRGDAPPAEAARS